MNCGLYQGNGEVIKACQFEDSFDCCSYLSYIMGCPPLAVLRKGDKPILVMRLTGRHGALWASAYIGDYIVNTVNKGFHVINKDDFEREYEQLVLDLD